MEEFGRATKGKGKKKNKEASIEILLWGCEMKGQSKGKKEEERHDNRHIRKQGRKCVGVVDMQEKKLKKEGKKQE